MLELLTALTLAAQAIVALALACWIVERVSSRSPLRAIGLRIGHDALKLAWLVAAVATAGSLYMSEVRHFEPCPLCWYQRIAMYPLVVLLGIAVLRRDHLARWYAIPIALVGLAIGAYHYQLERFPDQDAIACTSSVPCTTIWFEQLGYITIPMMAMSAFALVVVILAIGGRHGQGIPDEA
ncbi:MAG: disulfide oxidoreductase [Thermoleophilia bacterium]|nr:disulfide oxidoreductase [Thermoleophilia bacterium]